MTAQSCTSPIVKDGVYHFSGKLKQGRASAVMTPKRSLSDTFKEFKNLSCLNF